MKIKSKFFSMAVLLLFLGACSVPKSADVEKFMPPTIGEYKRNEDINQSVKNWFTADYRKPSDQIFYGFGTYANAQEAQMQITNKKFCDAKATSFASGSEVIKEDALKDKTGKEVGKILICREKAKDEFSDTVGNYKYMLALSNDKNYVYLNGGIGSLKDLTDFAEQMPLNSEIDFAQLNLQPLIAANTSQTATADQLLKLNPPVKLAKEPYIKGKLLIVNQSILNKLTSENPTTVTLFEKDYEKYNLTKDLVADSYEQAETIIQFACSKGARIGDYVTKDAEKKKFPAYATNCQVSVIDKTIPAIIAQKNLVSETLMQEEKFKDSEKEIVAILPYDEMQKFIKSLARR